MRPNSILENARASTQGAPGPASDKRFEWALVSCLFLLGITFRLPHLDACSLWFDEAWRVAFAEAPLKSFFRSPMAASAQIVSYQGLLRLVIHLCGHSEWSVRIVPALAGALAVPATYKMAEIALGRWPAVLASLLLCLSPLHITYSQEGAAYTIASLAVPIFLINAAALSEQTGGRQYIVMIASAAIMSLAHLYLAVFVIAVLGLYVLLLRASRKRLVLAALGCAGVMVLLNIPQLSFLSPYSSNGQSGFREVDLWMKSYPIRIANSLVSGPLNPSVASVFLSDYYVPAVDSNAPLMSKIVAWTALAAALLFAPISAITLARRNRHLAVWLGAVALYLTFLVVQPLITNHAQIRYIVPVLPICLVAFASIAVSSHRRMVNWLGALVAIALLLNFLSVMERDPPGRKWKPDARSVAERIAADCRAGPGVALIVPEFTEVPLYEFYLRQPGCKILRQPAYADYFYRDHTDLIYRSQAELLVESQWFGQLLRKEDGTISTVYIVSQRSKERADEIAEIAKPLWAHAERSSTDGILVIRLNR
jgi:4-amino-4-deoxy-L-arabinose transferase-like glycosyltransferase